MTHGALLRILCSAVSAPPPADAAAAAAAAAAADAAAGDHHAWAAFADAVLGWTMMQPGATLVFDDFW